MTTCVYIAGMSSGGGKSTIALGVTELLAARLGRVAAFRPLVSGPEPGQGGLVGSPDGAGPGSGHSATGDGILDLLAGHYGLPVGHGATYAEASALVGEGRTEELVTRIVGRFNELARTVDAVVVIGSDFGYQADHAELPAEVAFNVRLAAEFDALLLPVVDGRGRSAEATAHATRAAFHTMEQLGAQVLAVVVNRAVEPTDVTLPVPVYAIPDEPTVAAPTVAEVVRALGGRRLAGSDAAYQRNVLDFLLGAAHVPTALSHLHDGALLITPADRADLIVAAHAAHAAGLATPAGLVLTLGEKPDRRISELLSRLGDLAIVGVKSDSFDTVAACAGLEGRPTADNPRKVQAALGAFATGVDTTGLAERIAAPHTTRVTPLMFEYRLIERARAARRRVVLPEGTEERILRATDALIRRGVADLVLLGPTAEIERRARDLGLDVSGATLMDPVTSPLRDEFAHTYNELRKHKGSTLDAAYDRVTDVNYFGTLLVHSGRVDAMVSGAAHTTADTIRPAFEIIRTVPGVSVASSVFFMCLADRVLVYGDCAVNPDPTAEQLADIAVSSADTAARFGVAPRVALLSYSTGASGAGADVEKVARATALVRSRRPDLAVEGPIQYDAAIDPGVAAAKLPGSTVAGHATVLIFPDLNTGNNTYKAVQRSAGAVAVGPVIQGLRAPVNDLSRGATVQDIINTVAITAIQAQS
ncbi:phosphate acetyltransferase [Longispora fulva]|uniref:Phosphate acetyltransferase n=1 Tax=Longispora fulva TaxID=619741 RepID=A0A8J7GZ04_9ACTN|nr:phosphate acetyltransferase [Longispora fulva]MBG6140941.1 phosphate acetyltransferase [Longispora fulva]